MWRVAQVVFMVAGLIATCCPSAEAQPRLLAGTVVDQAGLPVPGARIIVEAPGDSARTTTRSDGQGRFSVRVPDGAPVQVRVERARFATTRVAIPETGTERVVITLDVAPVREHVAVAPPLVDQTAVDAFGGTTTIVTAAQVEQLHAVDLASALRRTPGVTISRFNPVGSFGGEAGGAVFVRGTGMSRPGSEVKAYIDGVPFYMGIWGHPLLDLLPVHALDSVQVHKGPQPQQFGNAFAAVDLGTRRVRGDGIVGSLRASVGAFATLAEQAEVTGRLGAWDFSASQGVARSDGHRPNAEGRLASGFARLAWRFAPGWSLAGTALVADNIASDPGLIGEPGTGTGRFASSGTLAAATLTHSHGRASGTVQVYANRGEGDWRGQPAPDGDTRTRFALSGLRWREQVEGWAGVRVSGGLDLDALDGSVQFDRVPPAPTARFEAQTLTLLAPYLAIDRRFAIGDTWSLQPSAGVRGYAHSVFATTLTPHAALVVRRGDQLAVRASYAQGASYPGQEVVVLSQLIPPLGSTWRQLRAEEVAHVELGAAVTPRPGTSVDLAWFRDGYARRYVFAFPPTVARPAFRNVGSHTVQGIEAAVHQDLGRRWRGFVGLTLLDASVPRLPYVPERALVAGVTGAVGPLRIAIDLQHQSAMTVLARARAASADNPAEVDGFTVVNARPSWVVPRSDGRVEVFAAVENLFDTAYAYRPGYPMPGAAAQVGVVVRAGRR